MTVKKNVFVYFNGLIMLFIGIGGLAYFLYILLTSPETFSFSTKIVIPIAALYAIGRGIFLFRKKS